ncbi:hypothetical protein CU097_006526 [Rhizopus azygosporus]|uniref:Uncharacterized protein n=2 Tax=Rhizopus TaxID=4842 RepID=A0A367JE80_RHIAZ|nr:hypothetical protein BCV71DRAFT_293043 [Rhizopus microsporus]RCH88041.1 hypothetical protein CU097_006526 [Rhizopus azygosporus]CEJ04861.1 hypothetical protein RMCBS344292_18812 [Rhizopus microsporus]
MKYWIYALLFIISIQLIRCVEEDDTSLFRQVDERRHPEVDDDDIEFKSMQDVTEGEEYIDDDSSLNEINAKISNEDNHEEEENDELDDEEEDDDDEEDNKDELENEEDEEEFFVFQNAETVEYFDNFPRTEDKQKVNIINEQDDVEEEQDNSNTIVDHQDDHTNNDLSELPSKQERPETTTIPWQRVEPHSSNEFYQDTPIYTPEEKLNPVSNRIYGIIGLFIVWTLVIVARKKLGNTDSAWSFKNYNDKDYCLPLHNRYLKSEMKSC